MFSAAIGGEACCALVLTMVACVLGIRKSIFRNLLLEKLFLGCVIYPTALLLNRVRVVQITLASAASVRRQVPVGAVLMRQ
jgi:hypothetical protein